MRKSLFFMAGQTRLELATLGVTGRYSNQTELLPRALIFKFINIIIFKNHVNGKCWFNTNNLFFLPILPIIRLL